MPVARPVGFTDAMFGALELHVTLSVISVVLPSEKSPLAVKAWLWPVATDAVAGVTLIACSSAAVTVADAVRLTEPIVAVIVAEPTDTPVTRPVVVSTLATPPLFEVHATCEVTSREVPSLYTPCAVNLWLWPDAMENDAGEIVRAESAAFTATDSVPDTVPTLAVIVTDPGFSAVSKPVVLTLAIVASELCHVT